MDLTLYLAVRFLEECLSRGIAPGDAEERLAELEDHLEAEESTFLQGYVGLNAEELESLSPEVHEWFLTRLALRPPMQREPGTEYAAQQVSRAYFLSERAMQRYLAIGALLAFDERMEAQERSLVAAVWNAIWNNEGLTDRERSRGISEVAEVLLDQCYFCQPSQYPLLALRQLLRSERRRYGDREGGPVSGSIAARAELVGGLLGNELARLIREV